MMISKAQEMYSMHWDIAKLLEMGVSAEWLAKSNIAAGQARELVKGLLYLKERFGEKKATCYQ